MTYASVVAAMLDANTFGSDELPGWSHPTFVVTTGVAIDFFASDDLPGWSRPALTVAA